MRGEEEREAGETGTCSGVRGIRVQQAGSLARPGTSVSEGGPVPWGPRGAPRFQRRVHSCLSSQTIVTLRSSTGG